MSGRIPQSFIDDLLARIDIVDLIDGYVPLRKAGKNHQACCPFHDEKTPSFTVSQDKQFYHCFGCGANGTAITFLMEYSRLGFLEAIEELANQTGMEIPREAGYASRENNFSELYELLELVTRFYKQQLRDHAQAKRAVDYLKQRGISGELAADFELGYAPAGWDNLIRELGGSNEAQKRLSTTGMTIQRENGGYYDRFRDRIMFPIRDQRGRMIGFGGRVIDDGSPKYLNSPETPIFHKGRELYGLHRARQKNKELERIYMVEGYMDVLALAQYGINNAVASLGTSATSDHLERLFKVTTQIIFCFDGDEAGQNAAWRAMETALPLLSDGKQAYFMFMPEGDDPDSFVREHGQQQFEDSRQYIPLSDYLLSQLKKKNNTSTREGRAGLVEQVLPYLNMMPQSALQKLLIQDLARLADTNTDNLEALLKDKLPATAKKFRPPPRVHGAYKETLISGMITRILHRPELATLIEDPNILDDNPVPGADFLKNLVELIHNRPQITCAGILENWRGSKYEARLNQLASNDDHISVEDGDLEGEFLDGMAKIHAAKQKKELHNLTRVRSMDELSEADKTRLRDLGKSAKTVSKE